MKFIFLKFKRYISILLYSPLAIIFRGLNIQVPYFHVDRIGHFLIDPDSFVKENLMNSSYIPRSILFAPSDFVANHKVSDLWKKYFYVIKSPILCRILMPLAFHPISALKRRQYSCVFKETADCYSINKQWNNRYPLVNMSDEQHVMGSKLLEEIGIRRYSWFICIHNREDSYAPEDENLNSHRNFPCSDFFSSVDYISSMGGVCVRMGDKLMKPVNYPGIIDYALSDFKSDFLDLYLGSQAKFFLGSSSGASTLSMIFGVPVATVNMVPLTTFPVGPKDISIPMQLKDKNSNRILSFEEILSSPLSDIKTNEEWSKSNVELVNNSPDDILELTKEQFLRVEGIYKEDDDANQLNDKLNSLYKPGHYCFGKASKMGDHFIKKCF